MAVDTTTAANAIKTEYEPGYMELVFRNNELLKHFPEPVTSVGDTAYRFKANTAGNNSVEIFTEYQPQPAAGNQSWSNLALSWVYFRGMLQATGHARDALRSNWIDAIAEDAILLRKDIADLQTTTWMASTYGIELAIDSTSTYAGQARGSAAWWEATETAVNAPVTLTDIQDLFETIRDNDKGGLHGGTGLILCPENQQTNLYRITATPFMQVGGDSDKSPGIYNQTYAGRYPIVALPDWTNTVIAVLDMSPGNWKRLMHRPFAVKDMGPSGDSDVYQVSTAEILACKNPKHQGKLTGCTA